MVPIHKSRRITPRLFSQSHFDRLVDLISDQAEKIVFGGQLDRESLYIASIIMDQVDWSNKVMLGEIFGPILPILSYAQIETAIDRINQVTNPLFLSIFTRNRQLATKCYSECAFGGGCVNDVANYRLSFGRVGDSGIDRYHDRHIIRGIFTSKANYKSRQLAGYADQAPTFWSTLCLALAKSGRAKC